MNNLKPGPEMDALVAKKVMSLTLTGEKSQYGERHKTKWPQGDIVHLSMDYAESLVPRYSTDIAAAWMVVEKLTANNDRSFEMHKLMNLDENGHPMAGEGKYVAHFSRGLSQKADSAPMAICLAALSAVGK